MIPESSIELYGSSRTRLNLPTSDYDLYINGNVNDLAIVYNQLSKQKWVKHSTVCNEDGFSIL